MACSRSAMRLRAPRSACAAHRRLSARAARPPPAACGPRTSLAAALWLRRAAAPCRCPRRPGDGLSPGPAGSAAWRGGAVRPARSVCAAVSRCLRLHRNFRRCPDRPAPHRRRCRRSWSPACPRSSDRATRRSGCRRNPPAPRAGRPSSPGRGGWWVRRGAGYSTAAGASGRPPGASAPPPDRPVAACRHRPRKRNPPRMLRMVGTMCSGASPASVW